LKPKQSFSPYRTRLVEVDFNQCSDLIPQELKKTFQPEKRCRSFGFTLLFAWVLHGFLQNKSKYKAPQAPLIFSFTPVEEMSESQKNYYTRRK